MNKDSISRGYMGQQKEIHADALAKIKDKRKALVTGTQRSHSIGLQITRHLEGMGIEALRTNFDVTGSAGWEIRGNLDADILVCSHGVTHMDWFEDMPLDKMLEVINVNLLGTAKVIQEFVKCTQHQHYRKQIIVIGSMAYKSVLNASAVYCASKAGVNMLCKCLAWELAPKGFDVFCINPSNVEGTQMTEDTIQGLMRYRAISREDATAYWGACLPKAQWLQTKDIANMVEFCITRGEYLSGSSIDMAGGQR